MANVISTAKKIAVISALVEGCSVRSTSRLTGVSKGAILRLLVSVGNACAEYHNRVVRNIAAKRVQVDEIWSFVGCKEKNVTLAHSDDVDQSFRSYADQIGAKRRRTLSV